ncbi:MAG TPA: hypothetical protein DCM87_04470 [Planctomycetes bacterium]|nr:hypothetical protein [Planctomycetota bacterium]
MSKRKTSFLLSSIVFVAVLLVITAMLNLIVGQLPSRAVRIDMTQHKEYTLSDATRQIFSRLNDLITVTYYVSKELPGQFAPLRQDTVDFLNEVKRLAPPGNFLINVVDPEEEATRIAAEREETSAKAKGAAAKDGAEVKDDDDDMQFDPFTGQMSTRKRTGREKVLDEFAQKGIRKLSAQIIRQDKVEVSSLYSAIGVAYKSAEEMIPEHQTLENFEYELASRVLKLTIPESEKPVVAFFNGQPKPAQPKPPDPRQMFPQPPEGEEEEYQVLKQALGELFSVQQTKLTRDDPIPAKAKTLILAQPRDLDKRQVAEIGKFVSSGGNLIVLAGNYSADMQMGRVMPLSTGLEDLLGGWGVKDDKRPLNSLQCGVISTTRRENTIFGQMPVKRRFPIPLHALARENQFDQSSPFLRGVETIVCPWAVAWSVEARETLAEKQIDAQVLVRTEDRTWFGKTPAMNIGDLQANGPEREEQLETFPWSGAQNLIALLRGTFPFAYEGKDLPAWPDKDADAAGKDDAEKPEAPPEKGRVAEPKGANVLVVGSPDFCKDVYYREHDQRLYVGNYFFLRSIVEAFSLGSELISIRSKQSSRRPLDPAVSATTKNLLKWFNVLGMPLMVAALGIIYAAFRRHGSGVYERRVQEERGQRAFGNERETR